MDGGTFDRLTKVAVQTSRRGFLGALLGIVMTVKLDPGRDTRAQSGGLVVLGGTCTTTADCVQPGLGGMCTSSLWTADCGDNGFPSDGPLTCCTEGGCQSDADCCGDLRCGQTVDCGGVCALPPFPTRAAGQVFASHADCLPGLEMRCEEQVCTYTNQRSAEFSPIPPDRPLIPDDDAAMAAANTIAALEVAGDFYDLYRWMHPDAQAIVPREAMSGWYTNEFTHMGEPAPTAIKLRFISWTWEVTGQTYPETAEVALRQQLPDGSVVRDEIRLVKDQFGNWSWFFGRDRAFVEEQIARFPAS